tara:strand:+ start:108 stop:482 length:375 start_codon:yes stop_codon:yes gene_type:complete
MPSGELQDYSVESVASSLVLILGGIGAVLTILLSSRCACRVRLGFSDTCYIFDCSRSPPPDPIDEEAIIKKEDEIIKKEEDIIIKLEDKDLDKDKDKDIELVPVRSSFDMKDREPEPEPEILNP